MNKDNLLNDMVARMENLRQLISKDYAGDPTKLENYWWELKYWREAIERGVYDDNK